MSSTKSVKSGSENADLRESFFDNLIWMTTKDAAIYLRKYKPDGTPSRNAIRIAVCRGLLKARKWAGRLYFKRAELDRLLELSLV